MLHLDFDVDDFIRRGKAAHDADLTRYLASGPTPDQRAFALAQADLWPAKEQINRVHLGLRMAGRSPEFIAALYGTFGGWVLDQVVLNAPDPKRAHDIFGHHMVLAFSGQSRIGRDSLVSVDGRPMGRA